MKLVETHPQRDPLEAELAALEPRLRRIFGRYRVPAHDAEDLLQESLLTYLYKRDTVQEFGPWLLGVVSKRCLMYWRKRRRQVYVAVDTAILEGVAEGGSSAQERADLRHDVSTVLRPISERCRSLLRLRYGLGCDPADAAERLGYKPSSIYKVLERCLATVAGRLTAAGWDEPPARR